MELHVHVLVYTRIEFGYVTMRGSGAVLVLYVQERRVCLSFLERLECACSPLVFKVQQAKCVVFFILTHHCSQTHVRPFG